MLFVVHFDWNSELVCLSPSSSDKQNRVSSVLCHPSFWILCVAQCCTVFASLHSFQLSTDQGHAAKLPDVRSVLSSVNALDRSANFVFSIFRAIFHCTTDIYESLSHPLEMRSADVVVSQLQRFPCARPTNRHHDWAKLRNSFKWWHC